MSSVMRSQKQADGRERSIGTAPAEEDAARCGVGRPTCMALGFHGWLSWS